MKQRNGKPPEEIDGVAVSVVSAAGSAEAATLDELTRRMLLWSRLWYGHTEGCEPDNLVRERLASWLERCIGARVRGLLTGPVEEVSLAISTPMLTAFLGRRAMLEVSRRVLKDL